MTEPRTAIADPTGTTGRSGFDPARPIGRVAFLGVALTSFGGPLALAALYAPTIVAGASASAGLAMAAAMVVFVVPLAIWLRYSRRINSSGGLFSFVEAAVGRRVALVQAGLWILSYLLYVIYTTAQVVYDTLPNVLPGEKPFQPLLELAIPILLAGVMLAGRRATLIVTGVLGFGQLALALVLGGVTVGTLGAPLVSFGANAPAGSLATSAAQTTLLYICGSLPLFLGGETPVRTVRRGIVIAYAATAVVILAAVFPLAADPAISHTEIPGMTFARMFVGRDFAAVIGIGVVASVCGVMLVEYLALTRLIPVVTLWPRRSVTIGIGVAIVAIAPISLIDPDGFYDSLIKLSLVALWLSQLMVFAVYPWFIRKEGGRAVPAWILATAGCAFALYGIWATLQHASS
jgi:amino acid transporter